MRRATRFACGVGYGGMHLQGEKGHRRSLNAEVPTAFLTGARLRPARGPAPCETPHSTACRLPKRTEIAPARADRAGGAVAIPPRQTRKGGAGEAAAKAARIARPMTQARRGCG